MLAVRLAHLTFVAGAVALTAAAACGGSDPTLADGGTSIDAHGDAPLDAGRMPVGLLQFRVEHNLADDSCVARGDCSLTFEDETDTAAWLAPIAARSTLAVLHWDRDLPWLAFSEDPPAGTTRVSFYDGRVDAALGRYFDAFAAHFASLPAGYLAATPLNGLRNGLSPFRVAPGRTAEVAGACPTIEPETVAEFQYDDNGPHTASFPLLETYRNFVLYLADKLGPRYLALVIEANIFKVQCPAQWPGLVRFYQRLYDEIRAELGPGVSLFATLVYSQLLGYQQAACSGDLTFGPCSSPPPTPAWPTLDPLACYPMDASAIADLDEGDRLDLLALSFYPDGLDQSVGDAPAALRVWTTDWDGVSPCLLQAALPPFLDPLAPLDRLAWTKPVALAETSARSCPVLGWLADATPNPLIVELPGTPESQAFWTETLLGAAQDRRFAFYVGSFARDYAPLGLWTVRANVLAPSMFTLINTWACSGILDAAGQPKGTVTDRFAAAARP